MRNIILAALVFASQISFAQNRIQTSNKNDAQVTTYPTTLLEFPFAQVTPTSATRAILDTGNKNMLPNAGFEHTTYNTGWSVSGGSMLKGTTTNAVIGSSLRWTPSGSGQTLTGPTIANPLGIRDVPGSFFCWVKTDDAGLIMRVDNASAVSLKDLTLPDTNNTFQKFYVDYNPVGTVSVTPEFESPGAISTIAIDECGVEPMDLLRGSVYVPWTAYTPTVTAAGMTNYTTTAEWMREGENAYYRGKITFTGAPGTWSGPIVSVPSGQTLFGDSGLTLFSGRVTLQDVGNNAFDAAMYLTANRLGIISTTGTGDSGSAVTQAAPFTWVSGDSIVWTVGPIKITEWIGSGQNVMSLNTLPNTTNTSNCTITSTWVTNATHTCKVSKSGDIAKFNVGILLTGAPTAAALALTLPAGYVIDTAKINAPGGYKRLGGGVLIDSGTGVNGTAQAFYNLSNTIVYIGYLGSGITLASVSNTVPFTWANTDGLSVDFEIPIVGWSATAVDMPLVTSSVITAPGLLPTIRRRAIITACPSSPCTFSYPANETAWVTNITRASAGNYTWTWPSSTFSAAPTCKFVSGAIGGSNGSTVSYLAVPTTTGMGTLTISSASSPSDQYLSVECEGPR